jgi:hypothetical protein
MISTSPTEAFVCTLIASRSREPARDIVLVNEKELRLASFDQLWRRANRDHNQLAIGVTRWR